MKKGPFLQRRGGGSRGCITGTKDLDLLSSATRQTAGFDSWENGSALYAGNDEAKKPNEAFLVWTVTHLSFVGQYH